MPGGGVRAVIDTNVLVSGLIWRGAPHLLVQYLQTDKLTLVSSPALLDELTEVLSRKKFRAALDRSGSNPVRMVAALRHFAQIVDPLPLPAPVSRDSDDDIVLALAAAARPDLIISGDRDLLTLEVHAGIPIVDPAQAVQLMEATFSAERG